MIDDDDRREEATLTRRDSLLGLGGIAAAALGAGGVLSALDDDAAIAAGSGPAAVASGLVTCVLTPEMTAGPFILDGDKVRRDIREGRPGARLELATTVVDVSTCKPIRGAAVDVWHCDAGGHTPASRRRGPRAGRSCAASSEPIATASRGSRPSTLGGTPAGRCTSTSRSPPGERPAHRAAVLPRAAHGCRLPECAVPRATEPRHAQRDRLDLPERRRALDAQAREERRRLRRPHHDGDQPLVAGAARTGGGAAEPSLSRPPPVHRADRAR